MQDENPYQPPMQTASSATPTEMSPEGKNWYVASATRRFLTYVVDSFGCLILYVCLGVAVALLVRFTHSRLLSYYFLRFHSLAGIVVYLIYYFIQESLWGRTLGKLLVGTIVISVNGTRPTTAQIIGRTFCHMIPFEAFSFLFGGSYPIGWHDNLSSTRVVMNR